MNEKQLFDDYQLRGESYEVWAESGPDSWYLVDPRKNTVVADTDFDPPLTHQEIQSIYDAVFRYYDQWSEP